jgi:uncharacterized protein (DUF302 family)
MRNVPLSLDRSDLFLTNEEERLPVDKAIELIHHKLKEKGITGVSVRRVESDGTGCICRIILSLA